MSRFKALLICNTYSGKEEQLDGPHSDGEYVSKWLGMQLGGVGPHQVHQSIPAMIPNATGKNMKQHIRSLGKRLEQAPGKHMVCSLSLSLWSFRLRPDTANCTL
jgi:Caspase domain